MAAVVTLPGLSRVWDVVLGQFNRWLLLQPAALPLSHNRYDDAHRIHLPTKAAVRRMRGKHTPTYDKRLADERRFYHQVEKAARFGRNVPLAGTGLIEGIRGRTDERKPNKPTPILGEDAKQLVIGQVTYVNELDPLAVAALIAGGYTPPQVNKSNARVRIKPFTPPNAAFAPGWNGLQADAEGMRRSAETLGSNGQLIPGNMTTQIGLRLT